MSMYEYFLDINNKQGKMIHSDSGKFNNINAFINEVEGYFDRYKDEIYSIDIAIKEAYSCYRYTNKTIYAKNDVNGTISMLT